MKLETIHTNVFGSVINPCSATGIQVTGDNGEHFELHIKDGEIVVEHMGFVAMVNMKNKALHFKSKFGPITGKNPTHAILDDHDPRTT